MNQTKSVLIYHPKQLVCDQISVVAQNLSLYTESVTVFDGCIEKMESYSWGIVFIPAIIGQEFIAKNFIKKLKSTHPHSVIVLLAENEHETYVKECLSHGAYDYLMFPFNTYHVEQLILRSLNSSKYLNKVIANSASSQELFKVAYFAAQANVSVLISGESGSGKEVVAQFIHNHSLRSTGPFIAINCAAIPESMMESILFGHAKGAFTGAVNTTPGKLECANGGTLFLDEIGELPVSMQAKLLRVLQEREVERLGCHKKISLDIRVVAATNKDLSMLVHEGKFRDDLYYRLNVFPLFCKPLRENKEDIIPLSKHILKRYQPNVDYILTEDAEKTLMDYPWPGNVRELDNVIQRALVMARGCIIDVNQLILPRPTKNVVKETVSVKLKTKIGSDKPRLHESRKQAEFKTIIETLKRFDGHRNNTAQELGLSSRALRYKIQTMKEQGVDIDIILSSNTEMSFVNNYRES